MDKAITFTISFVVGCLFGAASLRIAAITLSKDSQDPLMSSFAREWGNSLLESLTAEHDAAVKEWERQKTKLLVVSEMRRLNVAVSGKKNLALSKHLDAQHEACQAAKVKVDAAKALLIRYRYTRGLK